MNIYFNLILVTNKIKKSNPPNPMDYKVHGIPQAIIVEWVAFPFSSWSSQPRNQTMVSCIAGRFFTSWATREALFLFLYYLLWKLHKPRVTSQEDIEEINWNLLACTSIGSFGRSHRFIKVKWNTLFILMKFCQCFICTTVQQFSNEHWKESNKLVQKFLYLWNFQFNDKLENT